MVEVIPEGGRVQVPADPWSHAILIAPKFLKSEG